MARIAGVDLPKNKRIDVALAYIYGVGSAVGREIVRQTGIAPTKRVKDLTENEVNLLNTTIVGSGIKVEGDLRREVQGNIRRLIEIGAYRGSRHRRNLPVRGQRTKTNARTRRGKRKTVGAVKREVKKVAAAAAPAEKK